jgi:hypothetical protein
VFGSIHEPDHFFTPTVGSFIVYSTNITNITNITNSANSANSAGCMGAQ